MLLCIIVINDRDVLTAMFHSRKDLLKLLELAQLCIQSSSDRREVDKVIELTREIIPFSAMTICLDNSQTFQLTESKQVINYGYSEEWVGVYFQKAFQKCDPVISRAQAEDGAFTWLDAYRPTDVGSEFLALSKEFVGANGLACSLTGKGRNGSTLISMSLRNATPAQNFIGALDYLTPHLHEIFNRQGGLNRSSLMAPEISKRELEVLNWAKEGKSNWDISAILCISERTVKFHFGNIFRKLDVINRSQAIAKAIHYGVIAI